MCIKDILTSSLLQVLPVVIFFSSIMSILYHLGVMQCIIKRIAWVMQITMATSATESIIAAGNIFLGVVRYVVFTSPID